MDKLEEITNYIKTKYDPSAIILTGSRARSKDHTNLDNDWDLYIFSKKAHDFTIEDYHGEVLEIVPFQLPLSDEDYAMHVAPFLAESQLLFEDGDKVGTQILSRAKQLIERKQQQLVAPMGQNYLVRTLKKMGKYNSRPDVFFAYLARFYHQVIDIWATQNIGEFYPYAKTLVLIEAQDPILYSLMLQLISNNKSSEKILAAHQIINLLFQEKNNDEKNS